MRVARWFAFIDLGGFTAFTETHGDEQAVWVLGLFRWHVREVTTRRGVRVAKWLGDGAMLVSVEPRPLVEAVIEIEQRVDEGESPLKLRAGLAGGQVILMEGDDYIGHPVNLAARLGDEADPHEILATPEVAEHAPPWVRRVARQAVRLQGFLHPVEGVSLEWGDHGGETVVDPVCSMELPVDGVVAWRTRAGEEFAFCSPSCVEIWETARDRGGEASPAAGGDGWKP